MQPALFFKHVNALHVHMLVNHTILSLQPSISVQNLIMLEFYETFLQFKHYYILQIELNRLLNFLLYILSHRQFHRNKNK